MTTDPSNGNLSGQIKQLKGHTEGPSASQVANRNLPEFLTSNKLAPQPGASDGCFEKHMTAIGLEKGGDISEVGFSPEQKIDAKEKMVKQVSMLDCVPLAQMDSYPTASLQEVHTDDSPSHVQMKEPTLTPKQREKLNLLTNTDENALKSVCSNQKDIEQEQVYSPTTSEKKVKFTTIVTLQKEKLETTDITRSQTKEKVAKQVPAERKSNLKVAVTLQKENTLESSPRSQQDKSPVLKPNPVSPNLTYSYSNKQHIQEAQVSRDQAQYTEGEGGSLGPDHDDEGPPPPPPASKIVLHISKSKVRTQSKGQGLDKLNGSDIQTVDGEGTGESTDQAHENHSFEDNDDFDRKPIIFIFNEPMDIQSAYKRLSTIFEYDEDLDDLSPDHFVDEEETNCIIETNLGFGLKDVEGHGQNSLHVHHHHRPSADDGSIPDNQDQGKPDSCKKTETKKKFKFKFPKNKLAAISQAIRTGVTKTGKKTLEVVVYEEEESADGRTVKDTKAQLKESKRFEINSAKLLDLNKGNGCDRDIQVSSPMDTRHSKTHSRVEKLCKNTYDTINSLEESIKQLEISVDSISAPSSPSSTASSPPRSPDSSIDFNDRAQLKSKVRRDRERSPSKRPAPHGGSPSKGAHPPQSKRAKPQPQHHTMKSSTKKQV